MGLLEEYAAESKCEVEYIVVGAVEEDPGKGGKRIEATTRYDGNPQSGLRHYSHGL